MVKNRESLRDCLVHAPSQFGMLIAPYISAGILKTSELSFFSTAGIKILYYFKCSIVQVQRGCATPSGLAMKGVELEIKFMSAVLGAVQAPSLQTDTQMAHLTGEGREMT